MYRKITTNYKFSGSKRYKILAGYGMLVTFDPIKTPTCWLWFSSVQFKMVSVRSECSPTLPLKQFQCSSDLILTEKIFKHFLFPRLSSSGDRWCDVLGFVPTGSVSSSSTFQIFRDAHHLWWSLPACLCALSFPSVESSTQQVKDRLVWNMKVFPCNLVSSDSGRLHT